MSTEWIPFNSDGNGNADILIYCFCHAGGNAAQYNWGSMDNSVSFIPIELPGRGTRRKENTISNINALTTEISIQIARHLQGRSFALFGHSMGGILSFEIAKLLETKFSLFPRRLIISSCCAPKKCAERITRDPATDIKLLGGTPDIMLDSESMRSIMISIMQADYKLLRDYTYDGNVVLSPISAFVGDDDPVVSFEEINMWKNVTSGETTVKMFAGNHFYLFDRQIKIRELIASEVL